MDTNQEISSAEMSLDDTASGGSLTQIARDVANNPQFQQLGKELGKQAAIAARGVASDPQFQKMGQDLATASIVAASKGKIQPNQVQNAINVANTAQQVYSQVRSPVQNPQLNTQLNPQAMSDAEIINEAKNRKLGRYIGCNADDSCKSTAEVSGGIETIIAGDDKPSEPQDTKAQAVIIAYTCHKQPMFKNLLFACLIALLLTIIILYIWKPDQLDELAVKLNTFIQNMLY